MKTTRRTWPWVLIPFAGALCASLAALPRLPLRAAPYPTVDYTPELAAPGDDAFFIYAAGDELSQLVLYHDLGGSIAHARAADILFIGSSQAQLGLSEPVIVPAARALGLRAFNLACGHNERIAFALEVIRRHDLRPKIVVVAGGPQLFGRGLSGPAAHAATLTRWQATKRWLERRAGWALAARLHARVPRIDWHGLQTAPSWILYRSERTGWWRPVHVPAGRHPVGFAPEHGEDRRPLGVARELADELRDRGALLVATTLPHDRTRTDHLQLLAEEVGAIVLHPELTGYFTTDGSHLDRASAAAFSADVWDRLIADPAVRRALSLSSAAPRVR